MGKYIKYKGRRIHYTDSGVGEAIVFIHGYLESADVWSEFISLFGSGYRVIATDLPGNGLSDIFPDEHTMCFLAGSVLAVLDQENIRDCFLVGHSLGGYVTLSFLENYPSRLKGYILFHSHPFADTDEVKANRLREIDIVRQGKKDIIYPVNIPRMFADNNLERFVNDVERLKEIASQHKSEGIISVVSGMMNRKARDQIMEASDIPMMLILGRWDNYINHDLIIGRVKLPSAGRMVTLEHSGHMGFIEERDASYVLIKEFVDNLTITG